MIRLFLVATAIIAVAANPLWSAQQPPAAKPLTVNQLAAKPDAYVGQVAVVGRVAAATKGKGFTLIDSSQCSTCATDCLPDKTTKKIPFIWNGAAPVVKGVVRVDGTLAKTAQGYTFTAERVTEQ